jgi:hypothetical protein
MTTKLENGKKQSKPWLTFYAHWFDSKTNTTIMWSSELSKLTANAFAQRISSQMPYRPCVETTEDRCR